MFLCFFEEGVVFLFFFFYFFFLRFRFKGNCDSHNRAVEPRFEQIPAFLA